MAVLASVIVPAGPGEQGDRAAESNEVISEGARRRRHRKIAACRSRYPAIASKHLDVCVGIDRQVTPSHQIDRSCAVTDRTKSGAVAKVHVATGLDIDEARAAAIDRERACLAAEVDVGVGAERQDRDVPRPVDVSARGQAVDRAVVGEHNVARRARNLNADAPGADVERDGRGTAITAIIDKDPASRGLRADRADLRLQQHTGRSRQAEGRRGDINIRAVVTIDDHPGGARQRRCAGRREADS